MITVTVQLHLGPTESTFADMADALEYARGEALADNSDDPNIDFIVAVDDTQPGKVWNLVEDNGTYFWEGA